MSPQSGDAGLHGHFQSLIVVNAEASTPGGEPELYQPRAIVGPWLRSVDGPVQAGPASVDITGPWKAFSSFRSALAFT